MTAISCIESTGFVERFHYQLDETWFCVKMQDKYKKAYIWCLVNKSAGIVITKALHNLKNAWTPVMAYRNNGRYSIDNSIADVRFVP